MSDHAAPLGNTQDLGGICAKGAASIRLVTIRNYPDLVCGIVHIDDEKSINNYLHPTTWKLLCAVIELGARAARGKIKVEHVTLERYVSSEVQELPTSPAQSSNRPKRTASVPLSSEMSIMQYVSGLPEVGGG